jgi:16S rRNA (uracil1498-N3)-methyltransferase
LLIGPEGDWTAEEIAMFNAGGMIAVSLGATILRVETAAIAAAVFAASIERVGG